MDKTIEVSVNVWNLLEEIMSKGTATINTGSAVFIVTSSSHNTIQISDKRVSFRTPLKVTLNTVVGVGPLEKTISLDFSIPYLELSANEIYVEVTGSPIDLRIKAER